MASTKGNKFWQLRSKHGRDKLFATPNDLWKAACEYFQWCEDNPWIKKEAIKSGEMAGTTMDIPTSRPFTLNALCLYLDCNPSYFRIFKAQLKETDPYYQDFNTVIGRIEEIIYTNKFEGAVVGAYNANIIARDLGLADKVNTDNNNFNYTSVELTKEEMKEISKTLEDDY